jgi:hypothetical protein
MKFIFALAVLMIATLPVTAKVVNGTQYPSTASAGQIATDQKQKARLNSRIDYDPDPFVQLMLRE